MKDMLENISIDGNKELHDSCRVFPDGSFKVLDRGEYKYHKSIMRYSEKIDSILKSELTNTELFNW